MKKYLILIASLFCLQGIIKSQSNLTLVIKDEVKKGYFKQESFDWVIQGLHSKSEVNNFLSNIKKDNNIKNAELVPDGSSSGDFLFRITTYKIYGKQYFVKLLKRNGVTQAIVNGKNEDLSKHSKGE
ncbi:MAG: hypothetical protein ACK5D5_01425 [Bacteroidota bacterium]